MFVVDDLVGWLVGRLADAGYKKLTTLLRGRDQARALKEAVTAAVEATVGEIGPFDREEAERVAGQINKAFGRREPVPLPHGQPTLLEALQAGLAGQLSVLDDAGKPVVSLPGVPVSVVAAMLTGHLVREIQIRGSRGGQLTPLAGQLNDDLTHLQGQRIEGQGQRIEGMLAQVLDWPDDVLAPASSAPGPVGWPLADVADPFALEVHLPVEPDVPQPGLPVLPAYVPREHDAALAEVVTAAATGASRIAVLVGGSSTGKTRACWQALELLRGLEPGWRLWHPIDPRGTLADLPGIGPRTVVWLNEAQRYLGAADGAGERVAARLRELLRAGDRGPVLMLATVWPEPWDELTVRPPGGVDPHAQARELLAGHDIRVPAAFTPAQLRELRNAGDPRLAQAAAGSRDGQVIQYLAGALELLARYHNAPPAVRALIEAAMDASRLDMRDALPRAFLEEAAPGYLTDTEWDLYWTPDWLEKALGDTARPAKGVSGPLTPRRPRPAPGAPASPDGGSAWQLADYLDQHGRRARREEIPPASFWAATASYADAADLASLGEAAEARGLFCDAGRLYKEASAHGDIEAGGRLVRLLHPLHPGDACPSDWAVGHASVDDPSGVAGLLDALRRAGATRQVTTLADRAAAHVSVDDPSGVAGLLGALRRAEATRQVTTLADRAAAHVSLDDPSGVAGLLAQLLAAEATGQVATLLERNPAAHARLDNPAAVAGLLDALHRAGATRQVTVLADRAAAHVRLDNLDHVAGLLDALRRAGATSQVATLLNRDPAVHARLDDAYGVGCLLGALRRAGATGQVTTLLERDPAAHARLDNSAGVDFLLDALSRAGATGQVTTLADRAAARVSLENPARVVDLLGTLGQVGAAAQAATLLERDPAAHARLDNPAAVAELLDALRRAGVMLQVTTPAGRGLRIRTYAGLTRLFTTSASRAAAASQAATLLDRDPATHARLDNPDGVAQLLALLLESGATGQVTTLLDRDPAAHARLDNPAGMARLLAVLREQAEATGLAAQMFTTSASRAAATSQVTTLVSRAAYASLDHPDGVAGLLGALRAAGARAQAAELTERLSAAGLFPLFCQQEGRKGQFRFGRTADGRPAGHWAWTDLA